MMKMKLRRSFLWHLVGAGPHTKQPIPVETLNEETAQQTTAPFAPTSTLTTRRKKTLKKERENSRLISDA